MQILVMLAFSPENIIVLMDTLEWYQKNGAQLIINTSIIINSGGHVYNIEGGLDVLRKFAEKEKKEKEKNNTNESGL